MSVNQTPSSHASQPRLTILHGDDLVKSRAKLVELTAVAKKNGQIVVNLDAKTLTLAQLEEALGSHSLFAAQKLVVIEQLHALPKSKKKTALLDLVADFFSSKNAGPGADGPTGTSVVLIEKKALTATQLKKFPQAQTLLFKISSQLFQWLDAFVPSSQPVRGLRLLDQALQQHEASMCFYLLIRQVRLLIQVKDGGPLKLPGFMLTKLRQQAQKFSLEQLLTLHQQLLQIDLQQKTSRGFFDWRQSLEQLHLRYLTKV